MFYRRHLPHWIPQDAIVFLSWRVAGSLARLQDPRSAAMLVNAFHYGDAVRRSYALYAWVIMPDHVHLILQPKVELSNITRWLKGRTSRLANRILGRTGATFWQVESFDPWIRTKEELEDLVAYVETNPVKAGLVEAAAEWPWSSAGWQTTKNDGLPYL